MKAGKYFQQSDWPIELSPRNNVKPQIVGIRSTFRGSTFFRLVEIRHVNAFYRTNFQNFVAITTFKQLILMYGHDWWIDFLTSHSMLITLKASNHRVNC